MPTKTTHKATEITSINMKEVARLHGILKAIVSDRDSKFIFGKVCLKVLKQI